jgi:hypothetical protein
MCVRMIISCSDYIDHAAADDDEYSLIDESMTLTNNVHYEGLFYIFLAVNRGERADAGSLLAGSYLA